MRNVNNTDATLNPQYYLRTVIGTGGLTAPWSFVAMIENLTKSMSHMVCFIWKFSRGGQRTAFFQATLKMAHELQSYFPRQSKTCILKSSGF